MFGKIIGTGSYVPENIVTNNDLTKIVETSDSWIEERTGVKQRHLMKNETTATMATEAAKEQWKMQELSQKKLMLLWFLQYLPI